MTTWGRSNSGLNELRHRADRRELARGFPRTISVLPKLPPTGGELDARCPGCDRPLSVFVVPHGGNCQYANHNRNDLTRPSLPYYSYSNGGGV